MPSRPPTFWFPSGREARKARAAAAAGNGSGPPAPAAPAPTASKVVMCGAVAAFVGSGCLEMVASTNKETGYWKGIYTYITG